MALKTFEERKNDQEQGGYGWHEITGAQPAGIKYNQIIAVGGDVTFTAGTNEKGIDTLSTDLAGDTLYEAMGWTPGLYSNITVSAGTLIAMIAYETESISKRVP